MHIFQVGILKQSKIKNVISTYDWNVWYEKNTTLCEQIRASNRRKKERAKATLRDISSTKNRKRVKGSGTEAARAIKTVFRQRLHVNRNVYSRGEAKVNILSSFHLHG